MNLLQLAPDIQEAVLHLPRTENGRDAITERDLRADCGDGELEVATADVEVH